MTTSTKQYTIATVAKVTAGVAWFERMSVGVEKFGNERGHHTFLIGPPKADSDLQVQLIEDVITQGVDALCVIPTFPQALEMVLRKARKQGIVVITHEASNQRNVDYDVEAFDNAMYGIHLMDHLAKYMGEEGEYAVFVGSLTSTSHTEWVKAAIAHQKEHYPDMGMATRRIEDHEDQTIAYEKTRELLNTFPKLRGILGSAMSTAPGAARAIEKEGFWDKVAVVGTSLVSECRQYLKNEVIKLISFWDPAEAGYAMNALAVKVLSSEQVTDGMDLGVPGYHQIKMEGKVLYGSAWIDVTKDNIADYDF
jgi:simple sugar transport system substrate-binding protein